MHWESRRCSKSPNFSLKNNFGSCSFHLSTNTVHLALQPRGVWLQGFFFGLKIGDVCAFFLVKVLVAYGMYYYGLYRLIVLGSISSASHSIFDIVMIARHSCILVASRQEPPAPVHKLGRTGAHLRPGPSIRKFRTFLVASHAEVGPKTGPMWPTWSRTSPHVAEGDFKWSRCYSHLH